MGKDSTIHLTSPDENLNGFQMILKPGTQSHEIAKSWLESEGLLKEESLPPRKLYTRSEVDKIITDNLGTGFFLGTVEGESKFWYPDDLLFIIGNEKDSNGYELYKKISRRAGLSSGFLHEWDEKSPMDFDSFLEKETEEFSTHIKEGRLPSKVVTLAIDLGNLKPTHATMIHKLFKLRYLFNIIVHISRIPHDIPKMIPDFPTIFAKTGTENYPSRFDWDNMTSTQFGAKLGWREEYHILETH